LHFLIPEVVIYGKEMFHSFMRLHVIGKVGTFPMKRCLSSGNTGNPSITLTHKDFSLEKRMTALELQHMKRKGISK
jgi:hypothetical protein